MSLARAKEHLSKFGLDDRILVLDESSATVAEAAHALNTEPDRIAKTLGFYVSGEPILIVASGNSKIDNFKFKKVFGRHGGHMIPREEVESVIGHEVGGVCPFGIEKGVKVYLDESLKKYETVYPATGSINSAIELSIAELEKASEFTEWIDVTK